MRGGSTGETLDKGSKGRVGGESGEEEDSNMEPFVRQREHDPRELRSWAKRTGFVSIFSGGTTIELDPVVGRTRGNKDMEIENGMEVNRGGTEGKKDGPEGRSNQARRLGGVTVPEKVGLNGNSEEPQPEENDRDDEVVIGVFPAGEEPILPPVSHQLKYGVTDKPGFGVLGYYSAQHYLSLAGSLVFIPLLMVPAMGGTDKDTAYVISTMLLVSGITTLLHSFFGTRLPLVQGSSFTYLAPALVIMNSEEFRNLAEHRFRHTMRELQGAIIVGSTFQSLLGFSGLISLTLRFINPVVVAPTIAAVGLSFFSYGFPQAGSCVEISIPQILLLLIFTLYLRGVSISGHWVFKIYAVPLSVVIVWAYAFFLTAGGAYNYKGCSPEIPISNILVDACRKHAYTMKHCRTDVSDAWRTSLWVRIPYPLQWGVPVFRMRTSIIMILVSLVSSVDSVATYHSTALQINSKLPVPGIVSRGIGMEGFCGILAGLWGTGTASTTLLENVHTISVTKVASRRVVQIGAVLLIFLSFLAKVGALLACIPQALAASVLCFMWALTVALGFSNLKHTQTPSFRNMAIVGVSLFLGLSIPAYFQQYQPESSLIFPSYLIPYSAASSGPVRTGNQQLDFTVNGLLSLNMVVTLILASLLDNTVPGSLQERGAYAWSTYEELASDPESLASYSLPRRVAAVFCWTKCLGV